MLRLTKAQRDLFKVYAGLVIAKLSSWQFGQHAELTQAYNDLLAAGFTRAQIDAFNRGICLEVGNHVRKLNKYAEK